MTFSNVFPVYLITHIPNRKNNLALIYQVLGFLGQYNPF